MNDNFEKIVRREFDFLVAKFEFQLIDVEKSNYGCLLWYKNRTTVVRVSLELFDGGVFVTIYKVKDGNIPDYPIFFDPAAEFLIFDSNDLLMIKTGKKVEQDPKLLYKEGYLEAKLKEFSGLLQRHANDVLSGDFGILSKIKERVAKRAKELEDEH